MVKIVYGSLLIFFSLCCCSSYDFPADHDLKNAIRLDLNGWDCFQDGNCMQDSIIFIGIGFNYKGHKDSLSLFHSSALPFHIMPGGENHYVGTWRNHRFCIMVVNYIPQETDCLSHLKMNEFNNNIESYYSLNSEYGYTLNATYDGKLYRTFGKYHNGKLIIGQSGWFDNY